MGIHANSLENLNKGREMFSADNVEKARMCGRIGGKRSGEAKREKKNLLELFEIAQQAKVPDPKVAERES